MRAVVTETVVTQARAAPGGVKIVRIRPEAPFSWKAGQYAMIGFGPFPPKPYSIACAPGSGALEVHVKDFGGGGAGAYAARVLKPGESVTLEGPCGTCIYDAEKTGGRPLLLIAGGLGITPLRAIAQQAAAERAGGPVTLYWGAGEEEDLYLRDEFDALAARNPRFFFVPCGGGPPVGRRAAASYDGLGEAAVFVAGSPAMIADTVAALLARGAARERIHYDRHPEAAAGNEGRTDG